MMAKTKEAREEFVEMVRQAWDRCLRVAEQDRKEVNNGKRD